MDVFKFLTPEQTRALARSASTWYTIENYYKVKRGRSDEFISLWKQNHYPFLKNLFEQGDVLSIQAEAPLTQDDERSWWDFKVTIIFRDERLALDYTTGHPFTQKLYADVESYKTGERNRFGLLLAHLHIPVESLVLN